MMPRIFIHSYKHLNQPLFGKHIVFDFFFAPSTKHSTFQMWIQSLFPQLSSIGFVGFILAVINASMNIVNNANSNNNNRNNNNNENNDNNDNINIANLNTQQMNMQFVMAGENKLMIL